MKIATRKTEPSPIAQLSKAVLEGFLKRNLILGTIVSQLLVCATVPAATYYVSPLGNDGNPGTSENKPFQMVQYAIDQMTAGDTLIVLDGFYTGTLKLKSGITIKAEHPRKVVFSGAEVLKGIFEKYSGNIYKIQISTTPKQLFYKNQPMTWACWPNLKWSENWNGDKKWVSSAKGTGPGVLTSDAFSKIKGIDLTGGYCFLRYSKGNSCYSRAIKSFDGTTLHWDDANFYSGGFTGEDGRKGSPAAIAKGKANENVKASFFLAGTLSLLDSEGEWFAKDGTLYFYAPGGIQPNAADILCKTNDYSIDEEKAVSDISIEGIDFFATSVKLGNPGNKNINFHDDSFTYIGTELLFIDSQYGKRIAKPINIEGSNIRIDKCLFAGAQNTALQLGGSEITVQNCVFAENNRDANFENVALRLESSGTYKITRNTFFNNCSDAIRINFQNGYKESVHPEVSYNNIFNAGIYNTDVSGAYFPHLTQHWTEFEYNWVHNVKGSGVRLDQAGEEFNVHHNVFWSSLRGLNIEGYAKFNIYNNTSVYNEASDIMIRDIAPKRKGSDSAIVSNDTSFSPITNWNIINNLVQNFTDVVGPSEKGIYAESEAKGTLNPERAKSKDARHDIPITNRGSIQGNLTGFSDKIFVNGSLSGLDLIPADKVVENGVAQTAKLKAQGVTALDSFRGAYDIGDKGWPVGSDWMPFGLSVLKTMAQSEQFARKYHSVSIAPEVNVTGLPGGLLGLNSYKLIL